MKSVLFFLLTLLSLCTATAQIATVERQLYSSVMNNYSLGYYTTEVQIYEGNRLYKAFNQSIKINPGGPWAANNMSVTAHYYWCEREAGVWFIRNHIDYTVTPTANPATYIVTNGMLLESFWAVTALPPWVNGSYVKSGVVNGYNIYNTVFGETTFKMVNNTGSSGYTRFAYNGANAAGVYQTFIAHFSVPNGATIYTIVPKAYLKTTLGIYAMDWQPNGIMYGASISNGLPTPTNPAYSPAAPTAIWNIPTMQRIQYYLEDYFVQ